MDQATLGEQRTFGQTLHRRTAGAFTVTLAAYRPHTVIPAHAHTDRYLCVTLRGAFEEAARGGATQSRRGSVTAHAAGDAHANRFGGDGGLCLNLFHSGAHMSSGHDLTAEHFARLGDRIAAELEGSDQATDVVIESLAADLMAGLARRHDDTFERKPNWLNRVIEKIETDDDHPSLSALAAEAGVTSCHLARSFRTATGLPVGDYVRARKLARAHALVTRTRMSLADIAAASGFYDQSHFTRAFKARFGRTPSGVRAGLWIEPAPATLEASGGLRRRA